MRFYRKSIFWILLFTAGVMLFFVSKKVFHSIEVKTVPVVRQDLAITVTATSTGTIKSDKEVKVTAQRIGRISRLYVKEGDVVTEGSMIAELDPEEAYLNLELSRASLKKARAALDEVKAVFEPLRTEVEANIQKAEANLKEAKDRLNRLRELKKKGYVSQAELDRAERDYEVAQANYESALSGRGQLRAKAEEIAAREAAVREAENALALAELNYEYSFLKSPISGVVASRPVKLGETVMKGALVATVISTESLYIEAFVDEADVGKVKTGQKVVITMDAYPGRTFHGEVYMISPVVLGGKHETRTFEVRTRFKDKDVVLKPGMSADIEIVVEEVKNTLVLPSQAVMEREGKKFVYVKEGSRARLKEIKTGLSDWTYTQVISGVEEADEVIFNPDVPGLQDWVRLKVIK